MVAERNIFVHIKSFADRQRRPVGNEIVTYELKTDDRGRTQAESVSFAGEGVPVTSSGRRNVPLVFGCVSRFCGGVCLCWKIAICRPLALFGCQHFRICRLRTRQVSREKRSMANPGEDLTLFRVDRWLAGRFSRAKTVLSQVQKQSFQIVFWVTVVFNCGALGWLISPLGAEELYFILYTMAGLIDYYANKLHFWASVISKLISSFFIATESLYPLTK